MQKKYFIGLDNGGSMTKAGLYDEDGNEIVVSNLLAQPITPRAGHVERDSNQLFRANIWCIKDVIEKSGIDSSDIKGISVTGHGNGLYLVGNDGEPIYNGIISTDTRAADIVNDWYKNGVSNQILPLTYQNIWAGQLSSLLAWFKQNKKEILDKARYAFTCTDYVRFCLTGEAFGEITNMSAVSLMNLVTKDYDNKILKLFDIEEYKHLLPPIRQSHEICGKITPDIAKQTGLVAGTPVIGGLIDFAACPLATGVENLNQLSVTTGTWSICLYLSDKPIANENLFMTSLYPITGRYSIMEGSMTSASNLEWFIQKMMQKEKQEAEEEGRNIYQLCNQMVSSIQPEDCPVVFLPFLFGTNDNADAKSCFFGISNTHERTHLIRAIYEGVVFSAAMHIEKLMKFKSESLKSIRISGGAAKSKEWVQIYADTLQLPIEVSDAKELGTMGVAMTAAVGVGAVASFEEAIKKFVSIKYVCKPNPEKKEIYQKKYMLYKKLLSNMDNLWSEWNEL